MSGPDSPILRGTVIKITGEYRAGKDVLTFAKQNGIRGSFDAATGTLNLKGRATAAEYQADLRSVTYQNTSKNPTAGQSTLSIQVDDGQGVNSLSRAVTARVTVEAVNDAPQIEHGAGSSTEEDTLVSLTGAARIQFRDADAGSNPVLMTLSVKAGTLTLGLLAGAKVTAGANGTESVALRGGGCTLM